MCHVMVASNNIVVKMIGMVLIKQCGSDGDRKGELFNLSDHRRAQLGGQLQTGTWMRSQLCKHLGTDVSLQWAPL
jgi:hypothetical protein